MARSLTANHRVLKLPPPNHGQNGGKSNGQFAAGDAVKFRDQHGRVFTGRIVGSGKRPGEYRVQARFIPLQKLRTRIASLKAKLEKNSNDGDRWELKDAQRDFRDSCSRRPDGGQPRTVFFNVKAANLARVVTRLEPQKCKPRINGVLSRFRQRFADDQELLRGKLQSAGLKRLAERCALNNPVIDVRHKHRFSLFPHELAPAVTEDSEYFDFGSIRSKLQTIQHYFPQSDPSFQRAHHLLAVCQASLDRVENPRLMICFEAAMQKVHAVVERWTVLQNQIRTSQQKLFGEHDYWFSRHGAKAQTLAQKISAWLAKAEYLEANETALVWATKEAENFERLLRENSRLVLNPSSTPKLGFSSTLSVD